MEHLFSPVSHTHSHVLAVNQDIEVRGGGELLTRRQFTRRGENGDAHVTHEGLCVRRSARLQLCSSSVGHLRIMPAGRCQMAAQTFNSTRTMRN